MGRVDTTPVYTFEELLEAQEMYRQRVQDGSLIPLWWRDTQAYFAYAGSYNPRKEMMHVVLDDETLEGLFIADQRVFQSRWN